MPQMVSYHDIMEHPLTADSRQQPQRELDEFMHSSRSLQLLLGQRSASIKVLLDAWVKRWQQQQQVLTIQGQLTITPRQLISQLTACWSISVNEQPNGFRQQLREFINHINSTKKSGLVVIVDAHLLPIASRAALLYLSFLQNNDAANFKILLVGDPVCSSQINAFKPDSVPVITLCEQDVSLTILKLKRILQREYAGKHLPPPDIIENIHRESGGQYSIIYELLNRWHQQEAAANAETTTQNTNDEIITTESQEPVNRILSHRHSLFGARVRKRLIPGVSTLAAVVFGVIALYEHPPIHHHTTPSSATHSYSAMPVQQIAHHMGANKQDPYQVVFKTSTDKKKLQHWVARHPQHKSLPIQAESSPTKNATYSIEYGHYASLSQARKALSQSPQFVKTHHPHIHHGSYHIV